MNLLIIGGSQVVGHHLAECALARGRVVALFNDGETPRCLPPETRALNKAGWTPEREAATLAAGA